MNIRSLSLSLSLIIASPFVHGSDERTSEFVANCKQRLTDNRAIKGDAKGWFFPMREIKQLSLGKFWERSWEEVSRNHSDPVPSMIEFHNLLAQKGVNLLVVPIPAKATIYPEKFSSGFQPGEAPGVSPFVQSLSAKGLNVVDLEALFLEKRKKGEQSKFWCEQDAHYSPAACVEVADLIAGILEEDFGIEKQENTSLKRSEAEKIMIQGDLVAYSEWEGSPRESLSVQYVDRGTPLTSDINSPVLLLGDSHTLVFSDAENFHCEGAGLFDHLSSALGRPVDLEGNAAGGLVTSRINLFRKAVANPGYWDNKKVVVWVFTAREFTQSGYSQGFISIPIER